MVGGMRARLWRRDMRLRVPVIGASQRHATRSHLFLEFEHDEVRGLGEISPQPAPLHGDPGLEDVIDELIHFTLRHVGEILHREGAPPRWTRVSHLAGSRAASYAASTLAEMALLDRELRARESTADEHWVARFATPSQITVSLLDDGPWTSAGDAHRVRAKVSNVAVPPQRWERLAQLGLPVLLDFNCSASDPHDVTSLLRQARSFVEVCAVEQPFAPGNLVDHAQLARNIEVPVSLDEGVRHRRDLEQIAHYRAAQVICVKPARVGGYAQARTMIEHAQGLGLGVYLGGFFEPPLARRANRSLARHLVTLPSDIAPARLETTSDLLAPDPWGFGYLPGPDLETDAPLVTHQW